MRSEGRYGGGGRGALSQQPIGLLVMAHGTPRSPEAIEAFYTHIRHGRKPPDTLLQELTNRYRAIGGTSPLARITKAQANTLLASLNARHPDRPFRLYVGLKHVEPLIEDAVAAMHRDGIRRAVALALAPYDANISVQNYDDRAQGTSQWLGGPTITTVVGWSRREKFHRYWAEQISACLAGLSEEERRTTVVVFSAHSVPQGAPGTTDRYASQLEESARSIAQAAGARHYATGWQSAGRTPDPWLGPDLRELTRTLWETGGYRTFVYCPTGFVADHLEVLYDLDIECRTVVSALGGRYVRPPMPNATPLFIDCLADAVMDTLAQPTDVPA